MTNLSEVAKMMDLLSARNRLEQARRDLNCAPQEAERAHEREAQAERDAHLKHNLDASNVALDAMGQEAERLRQQARANTLTASALNKGKEGDALIEAAMKEANGISAQKGSALDRLKDL